jgi:hypothetical protein
MDTPPGPGPPAERPRRDFRPTVVGMVLLGVLAVSVGALRAVSSTTSASTTRRTATVVVRVRPVDDQGRLNRDFTVSETVDSEWCPSGSVKVGAPAHRCNAGHALYDPCWTEVDGPSGPSVLCMLEPWSHEVHRLLAKTQVAPEPPPLGVDSPWGVELADGHRCRVSTGAHDSLNPSGGDDADVVDYSCGEDLGLVLLRGINKTRPVWTARAARYVSDHYHRVEPQSIATAWF